MGMFRSPYDRGGVLSAQAQQERKKIYKDARAEEVRKREKLQLFLLYLERRSLIPPSCCFPMHWRSSVLLLRVFPFFSMEDWGKRSTA